MMKRILEDSVVEKDVDRAAKRAKKAATTSSKAKRAPDESRATNGGSDSIAQNGTGDAVETVVYEQEAKTLSKEGRKALRRAEKEAAKFKVGSNGVVEEDATATAERKAAEKAARKAARKAQKSSANSSATTSQLVEDAIQSNGHTNGTNPALVTGDLRYEQHRELTALPQATIDAFVSENFIAVEDSLDQPLRPMVSFQYLPDENDSLSSSFASFSAPTPIQAACWPYLLAGRDVIGVAETGSGKTLAFGVPCVRSISRLPKKERRGIKSCMVSPTRELAMQIYEQLGKLAEPFGIKVAIAYGGVDKVQQRESLKGANIIVATPGRLNDFIQEGSIDLFQVSYLVLDEADRMLDKGFEQEIRKIISTTPSAGRQTLMFTATWPPSVRELASTFMESPVRITIGENASGELRANARIVQEVEVIEDREKQGRLIELLKQYQSGKKKNDRILVFCLYKKEATRIEEFIRRKGFAVAGIHGDLGQQKRTESLEAFKQGRVPLLVATDVAARGLDIPAVKLVINVTFPLTVEDYVHRIGRTGRAGQDGKAITLFTANEKPLSGALINVLKAANQHVPDELLKFGTTVKKKEHGAYGAFYKDLGPGDMKKATKITFD